MENLNSILSQLAKRCCNITIFRNTKNILPYASINTHDSSARVDGPLPETHSSLTCSQPRGSQILSTQRFYPPTTARLKVCLYLHIGKNISLQLAILNGLRNYFISLRINKNFVEMMKFF